MSAFDDLPLQFWLVVAIAALMLSLTLLLLRTS